MAPEGRPSLDNMRATEPRLSFRVPLEMRCRPSSRGIRVRAMATRISPRTGYLFAAPSGLHGAARIFDYWGVYDDYNLSDEPENDLLLAIFQDWLTMEEDAHAALMASSGVHPE